MEQIDEQLMSRALRLAVGGRGLVEPNPMVGCVIARDGRVIGEGFHRRFGGPHAEPEALAALTEPPQGATAYVTLEPCCHVEKKTPPCVPALVEAKLSRVVVACEDPNPHVAGKGIEQLRSAGIEVCIGVCEAQAKQLNAAFFARVVHERPYVTLKWAQIADGKVAGAEGKRLRISGDASHRVVHELRSRCQAILVGSGTALADDPLLTARDVAPASMPLMRIILDGSLRLPLSSKLVQTAAESPVVLYCTAESYCIARDRVRALEAAGVQVATMAADTEGRLDLSEVLKDLYRRQVTHLLVEGGPTVARSFIERNLADRVWIFRSEVRIDAASAPSAPQIEYPATGELKIEEDRLTEYLNSASEVFFAAEKSADFQLVESRG